MSISVIVSEGVRTFYERYETVDEAWTFGETQIANGFVVIVRPNYNEKDASGSFFREWRSFNGKPFKECRWAYDSFVEAGV